MEISLNDTIELFIVTKTTEGRSPKTTTWYRDMLTCFSDYLGNPRLAQVSIDDARRFIAHLQAKDTKWEDHPNSKPTAGKLSTNTIHGYVRALKAFSNWMLGHTSLTVTQVYLHLADSHIATQHARFSPVDRLGLGTGRKGKTAGKNR